MGTGNDRVAELHQRLAEQVGALSSSQDWRALLDVARRFHRYSPSNVLLILAQRPQATRVAGYRVWQSLGRQVRRGEKGIAVLAPAVYRRRPADDHDEAEAPELARVLRGFTVVHVFDVAQTDGDDLPEVSPVLLAGDAPGALWDRLAARVAEAGFALERGDCGGANGRTDVGARTVRVRDDLEPAQAAKTLAHELAHVCLHDGSEYLVGGRERAEVEAESVAYLVCTQAGLTTDAYSFPYLAHWSGGDPAVVRATAERVVTCARGLLADLGLVAAGAAT